MREIGCWVWTHKERLLLLMRASKGVVSGNCVCYSSATEHKLQEGHLWWTVGVSAPCSECEEIPCLF